MSDNSGGSLGGALYGADGPASTPQGPNFIDAGKAAPAASPSPEVDRPPRADPRAVIQGDKPKSLGETIYGTPTQLSFDPTKVAMPEGLEADPVLMTEFSKEAQALKLDQAGADRLVQLHAKAMKGWHDQHAATAEAWRKETEAAYTPAQLADVRYQFDAAIGHDADAAEFRRLLGWSGIGNHPAAIRVISRLLGRR